MTDIIILVIVVSVTGSLWILKRRITTEFDEFAIIPENEQAPFDLWWTDTSRRSSLSPRHDHYYAIFDLERSSISQLPKRIYVNESATIVIHPTLDSWRNDQSLLVVNIKTKLDSKKVEDMLDIDYRTKNFDDMIDVGDNRTKLRNYARLEMTRRKMGKRSAEKYEYLTLELLASGFQIAGSVKQKQDLSTPVLTYIWNISTGNSGIHDIAIGLALEDESGEKNTPIGTITHKIKVVSLGPLTHRQINIFLAISGVITALYTILQVLRFLEII